VGEVAEGILWEEGGKTLRCVVDARELGGGLGGVVDAGGGGAAGGALKPDGAAGIKEVERFS
jgi:hypothetical protein